MELLVSADITYGLYLYVNVIPVLIFLLEEFLYFGMLVVGK